MRTLLERASIIPVVTVNDLSKARKLTQALIDGGIQAIEIVLRTQNALSILADLISEFNQTTFGAGTVINKNQMLDVKKVGAKFAISPGCTHQLIVAAEDQQLPFLPGVSTTSDIILALEHGINTMKLFPAELVGGIPLLKAYAAAFPEVKFCPTGGVNLKNLSLYSQQKNVVAIGGSWLIPDQDLQSGNWPEITRLARQSLSLLQST